MQADPVDERGGRGEMLCVCTVVRSNVKRADKRAEGTEKVEVEAGGSGLFGGEGKVVAAAAFLFCCMHNGKCEKRGGREGGREGRKAEVWKRWKAAGE